MIAKTCHACGETFGARSAAAKWCSDRCRKRVQRGQETTPAKRPESPKAGRLATATEKELRKLRKLDSNLGELVLIVARRLDMGGETSAAVASLSKEYVRLMTLIAGKGSSADPVDEMAKRREEKAARAREAQS